MTPAGKGKWFSRNWIIPPADKRKSLRMPEPEALQTAWPLPNVSTGAIFFSILAALASAFGALLFTQSVLRRVPAYPDFIVGAITWDAGTKLQDIASYPIFVLGFLGGGWMAVRLFQRISSIRSGDYEPAFITTLTWWLVPVAIGLGGHLGIYPGDSSFPIFIGVAGAIVTAVAVRLNLSRGDAMPQQIGIGVLAVMLIGLLPYGVAAIQDRVPLFGEAIRFKFAPAVGSLLIVAAALYLLHLSRRSSTAISRYVQKLLPVAQLGIAPFYLLILPDLYRTGTTQPAIPTTGWLWVVAIGLVLAAVADVGMRYRSFVTGHATDLMQLLSPVAIFATVILWRNGATAMPLVYADDYHFGERLLGWWSFWEFGKIPYLDYFAPHGVLVDDIGGLMSQLFYDGTAATIEEANRLASTLMLFVAFIALRLYTGSLGLAYVSILLFGFIARQLYFLAVVPFYCLWLGARNARPQAWLWTWLLSAPLLVLCVPPQGTVAVVASLPVVALYLYRARQADWKRNALFLALVAGALTAFTPIPALLYGAIRYVFENGAINQISYGMPWSWSWNSAAQDKGKPILVVELEVLRMSWVWVPLAAAALILLLFRQPARRSYLIGTALPVLLFASLMTPYAMGRIGSDWGVSRAGLLANFAWAVLLPLLLAPLLAARGRAALAVGIAFVCAGIGLASVNKDGLRSVLEKDQIGNLWSGAEHGLKNVGVGLVDPQHVERLGRIDKFLSSHLAPREGYLDLTGRNAQYMYFDRPPPMSVTAPYNLVPIKQQQRAVEQLSKALPKIALLEADNLNHDGGGLALRTHLLYRFVLEHYDAELHDGYVFGVAKKADMQRAAIGFTLRPLTDRNWDGGIHRSDNAVAIRDPVSVHHLRVGDAIVLPDNKPRKIVRITPEDNTIGLDGERFLPNPSVVGHEIQVLLSDRRRQEVSAQLMDRVFAVADLRKIPVAWGQSAGSLRHAMRRVADLDFSRAELHDPAQVGNAGAAPYVWTDSTQQNLAGRSAGLLQFNLACGGATTPRIRVSWWGDHMGSPHPSQSLVFTAANGTVIVPLDAYPSWVELDRVKGIRIDLEPVGACKAFVVQHATLNQRINLSDQAP